MKPLYHPKRENMELTAVLQALSDPIRLYLVDVLTATGEQRCGDIEVPVVKSTRSHHFRILREAGIIQVRTQGTQRFSSVRAADLDARFPGLLASILAAYRSSVEREEHAEL